MDRPRHCAARKEAVMPYKDPEKDLAMRKRVRAEKKAKNPPTPRKNGPMRASGGNGNGGKLKTGNAGCKGGAGRPRESFRKKMREFQGTKKADRYLKACLEGKYGASAAIRAHEFAAGYGYGRPTQEVEVRTPDGPLVQVYVPSNERDGD